VHYFRFSEDRSYVEFVEGIRIPLAPSMGVYAAEPEGRSRSARSSRARTVATSISRS
jgi:hypothetical protein